MIATIKTEVLILVNVLYMQTTLWQYNEKRFSNSIKYEFRRERPLRSFSEAGTEPSTFLALSHLSLTATPGVGTVVIMLRALQA